ncbi:MAG: hypothetical protein UV60_C0019G0008 [Parcubacteria group bacterium GW2011_GWA2_43_11]|nr:MAG: hypothetical protein UU89_C0043G0001 [Parcubacteria group bacterium GW2011_GWC2_42_11]KKS84520.1 MAG: hypothetical protein UV60_C0019G0008 [Parcubacteria group bacterium GW2011_GWA2_43_11]
MKSRKKIIVHLVLYTVFVSATLFTAPQAYGATHQLYTTYGFIDLLISRGIIATQQVERAREMGAIIMKTEKSETLSKPSTEDITVSVSQFIEHGDLTYTRFEDIEGLLLTVKNISEKSQTLTAKRKCQVVYYIYNDTDKLVYNSADETVCQTNEKVSYVLEAGKTRIFPITHKQNKFALQQGTYRFEIEYPEYGKGEVTVTVQ